MMSMREMVGETRIARGQYWSKSLTLFKGCTPVSEGCRHCWSANMASRFDWGEGFAADGKWTGKVEGNRQCLEYLWKRSRSPKRLKPHVFCIWNDFWHDIPRRDSDAADAMQMAMWHLYRQDATALMSRCAGDIFLILTKRPQNISMPWLDCAESNIWHGVTVESQQHIGRIDTLCQNWSGRKFVSIEPCLGSVDFFKSKAFECDGVGGELGKGFNEIGRTIESFIRSDIDWLIFGGETGPGARPCHPDWVRSIRDQCVAAGVPFWFKGWGEWAPAFPQYGTDDIAVAEMDAEARLGREPRNTVCLEVDGSSLCGIEHGKYWCTGQPRPECRPWWLWRVGRKKAGRLLDGRTWDEFPEVRT